MAHSEDAKEQIIENLKKTPVVQVVCEKLGIGRASYYRWRKEDKEFAKVADAAIEEGSHIVNDLAESQLMSAIKDKNLTAIIFWLKHHHSKYRTRVEITAGQNFELSPEEEEKINKALVLSGLITEGEDHESKRANK